MKIHAEFKRQDFAGSIGDVPEGPQSPLGPQPLGSLMPQAHMPATPEAPSLASMIVTSELQRESPDDASIITGFHAQIPNTRLLSQHIPST